MKGIKVIKINNVYTRMFNVTVKQSQVYCLITFFIYGFIVNEIRKIFMYYVFLLLSHYGYHKCLKYTASFMFRSESRKVN